MQASDVIFESYGVTDRGHRRETNQDQFLIADLGERGLRVEQTSLTGLQAGGLEGPVRGRLLVVADGLGGHEGGERASALAVEALTRALVDALSERSQDGPDAGERVQGRLREALESGEERVQAAAEREAPNMGTTLTVACLVWPKLHLAHVGDSRCYLLRDSQLRQVTEDHTVASEMVRRGLIDERQAETTKWQHVLHKAVGGGSPMGEPQLRSLDLLPGDTILLCTDGLTGHLSDETIGSRLGAVDAAEAAAQHLVNIAKKEGGHDNVTAVVTRVRSESGGRQLVSPVRSGSVAGGARPARARPRRQRSGPAD